MSALKQANSRKMVQKVKKVKKLKPDGKKLKANGKKPKVNGKKLNVNGKKPKVKGKKKANKDLDTEGIVSKPSKAELKELIKSLKKDGTLALVRKALKYIRFYMKSEGLLKKLLKEIIRLWAEAGEKVRVVCLLCLIRIYTKLSDKERKQQLIKNLYATFLEKCRITKHETMSMIGFMRHSLIELCKLDETIAMKQAQSSCQQLTVTLKNACTHMNEETYKTVLNWQFANCLIFLSNLVTSQDIAWTDSNSMKTLTHQVIQLNLGALNLLTSPRYYPYYCHLLENLISLSISTGHFIPIFPQLVAIVDKIQFPKLKSEKKSVNGRSDSKDHEDDEKDELKKKEYNMDLLNHVTLDESHSLEYNAAVLEKVYDLMTKYLASQCHKIAFPELVLLPCIQLKKWLKRNPQQHVQKFRILVDKLKSDCDTLEEARRSVDFVFTNFPAIDSWERTMRDSRKLSLPKLVTE